MALSALKIRFSDAFRGIFEAVLGNPTSIFFHGTIFSSRKIEFVAFSRCDKNARAYSVIFALFDYWQYARKTGRYGDDQNDAGMALSFLGEVPEDVLEELWPGDMILTQRLNSRLSWAMMYLTSSSVDHVAMYTGNNKVAHMTLSGFRSHSINVFGKNTRVLPVRLAPPPDAQPNRADVGDFVEQWKNTKPDRISRIPPKVQLAIGGMKIVLGFYPYRFRWKFLRARTESC